MSSNYKAASMATKTIEGAYCVGAQCGSSNSGETYKGIDRKFQPNWPGWQYVDAFKVKHGAPKAGGNFSIDPVLNELINIQVENFYTNWWNSKGLNFIKNQHLANLIYAFIIHRENAAVKVLNNVAISLGAKQTKSSTLTESVCTALEKNISNGYNAVRGAIIKHYNGLKNGKTYIKNRVNIFPESIKTLQEAVIKPVVTKSNFWYNIFR